MGRVENTGLDSDRTENGKVSVMESGWTGWRRMGAAVACGLLSAGCGLASFEEVEAAREALRGELGVGSRAGERKTIVLPGGAEMEMVWCPPGTFAMGSPEDEEGRDGDEVRHRVTLTRGFWMARTEVTQAQWTSVMGKNPSVHAGDGNLPLENASWLRCSDFCEKTGMQLPYEAEWEYACRAGNAGPFAAGGWCRGDSGGRTHPVGRKEGNAWGLKDMHGNVWEWCFDAYKAYPGGAETNPVAGGGRNRVVRGGGFEDGATGCRSAEREVAYGASGYGSVGFRPVVWP